MQVDTTLTRQDSAVDTERALRDLDSVHDCKILRQVAYVVPAASVRPERIGEWVASLKDRAGSCDVIAVSRLPLTDDGEIDEAELQRVPVVDQELARRCEDRLKTIPGLRDVVVRVETDREPLPPIHYSALLPAEPLRVQYKEGQLAAEPLAARPLAISHGEELRSLGELPRVLPETLHRAAAQHPNHGLRTIGVDGVEGFTSYRQLLANASRLLGGLRAAGLHAGDRVVFQFRGNADFLTAFWACTLGGFVPVPLAPIQVGPHIQAGQKTKLENAWKAVDAALVLADGEMAPAIRTLGDFRVECVDDLTNLGSPGEWQRSEPCDLALMMLTSGSTGQPKAVMLSHRNLIRRSAGSAQMNGFSSTMVTLNWMPLDHVAGLIYFHLRDVFLGCRQIHTATDLVLQDPLIWLEWVHRFRVTTTFAPNFAFGLVNDRAEDFAARARKAGDLWDLSCLRYVLNGAEAIVPRTARRFLQLLAPYGLSPAAMWPVWGMSETSSGTTYSDTFRLENSRDDDALVEVGRPIPGISLRITSSNDDANGQPIAEDAIGSLQVKGDVITAGYYNRPDLNAESFTPDGWFKTGDLGFLLNGRLTITGREKDVIVVNSVNYACHEIEGLVEEIDGVETSYTAACAVRDSGTNTDQLAIFFHPTPGVDSVTPDLIKAVRGAVSRRLGVNPQYLIPVEREAIPKTSIGKIQRAQLTTRFAQGEFADAIRRVEVIAGGANTIPSWFFRPQWRRAELRGGREIGPALIAGDDGGLAAPLKWKIDTAGYRCVRIAHGEEWPDFEPRSIVCLGSSLKNLLKFTALREGGPGIRLIVANDSARALEDAPLRGLIKTIAQEIPGLSCSCVELPIATPDATADANAALIFNELTSQACEPEVAYRGGRRWVRRLVRADLAAEPAGPMPIERGGLYLLSGGLGGIGLELARYLIERFQARLLLIGRSELTGHAGRAATIQSLEALATASGGGISYAALDIGDQHSLREAVRQAEQRWSLALDGVFHLAGLYHERSIAEETVDGVASILRPKVEGTRALHRLIEDIPDALFVSFSSVNGFLGGYGVGAYSAANSFLESFSEYQRSSTALRAYCVSWSLWDDTGMSRGYVMKEAARSRGFEAISPRQGLASLEAILRRAPSHTVVGLDGGNWNIRRAVDDAPLLLQSLTAIVGGECDSISRLTGLTIPDRNGVPVLCRINSGVAASANQRVSPEGEMENAIAGIWRKVLEIDRLGVTDNFFDLGGNSLAMAQANRLLSETLNRRIPMTEMFQYPTVRSLAAYLTNLGNGPSTPELEKSQSRGEQRRQMARARRRA